jgi:hypothetical protein
MKQSNLKAAFWMACSIGCLLLMTWAGRETTRELDVFQVMELRSLIGLAMLYPLIHMAGGIRAMATRRPLQHVGRNIARVHRADLDRDLCRQLPRRAHDVG